MERDELATARIDYDGYQLLEAHAPDDPGVLFDWWLAEAMTAAAAGRVQEPTAMVLATLRDTPSGLRPAARLVLMKDFDGESLTFYTNTASDKGVQLAAHPQAAATFWWPALFREVRFTGVTEEVDRATSEAYFAMRPRGAQLGAWASAQSRPVESADALAAAYAAQDAAWVGVEVPCPPHWGGYRLIPDEVEFWQGRPSRMHDRLLYARGDAGWGRRRLAP